MVTNPARRAQRRLGRYRVQKWLGGGGMGDVYLATDTQLRREVALKAMKAELAARSHFRRRFKREALNAARISHPYVAGVYDSFSHDGELYLVMELVRGESLAERLRRKPLSASEARSLALEAADALATIHAARLVHRDLKPGNVMLTPDGHLKLMDFGLARRIFDPDLDTAEETPLTGEGVVVGTHAYMSPEQLRGQPLDGRSDLFSLGVTLYEALCGLHPFRRNTKPETIAAILNEPPGMGVEPPELGRSGSLGPAILRLLEKSPARRFASAAELSFWLGREHPEQPSGRHAPEDASATLVEPARQPASEPSTPEVELLLERAEQACRDQQLAEAIRLLERARAMSPDTPRVRLVLAQVLERAGRHHEARDQLRSLSERPDATGDPQLELELAALDARLSGDTREEVRATTRWVQALPGSLTAQLALTDSLFRDAQYELALKASEGAAELDPTDPRPLLHRAEVLKALRRFDEALQALDRAELLLGLLGESAASGEVLRLRAITEFARGNYPLASRHAAEAGQRFSEAGLRVKAALATANQAEAELASGRLGPARRLYTQMLPVARSAGHRPLVIRARENLGLHCYSEGRLREAASHLRAAAEEARGLDNANLLLGPLANLASVLLYAGSSEQAHDVAEEALALARQRRDSRLELLCLTTLSCVETARGRLDEAIAGQRAVLELQQRYAVAPEVRLYALDNLAETLELQGLLGSALDAAERFLEAARQDPVMRSYAVCSRVILRLQLLERRGVDRELERLERDLGRLEIPLGDLQARFEYARGLHALVRGRPRPALELLERAAERAIGQAARLTAVRALCAAASAATAAGEPRRALELARRATRLRHQHQPAKVLARLCLATQQRANGELAASRRNARSAGRQAQAQGQLLAVLDAACLGAGDAVDLEPAWSQLTAELQATAPRLHQQLSTRLRALQSGGVA